MTGGAPDDDPAALLAAATDRTGHRPLPWLAAPLRNAERVLELCCGPGLLAGELEPGRWIGVDSPTPPGAHRPFLRADAHAVPLRTDSVDGIALPLVLPALADPDRVFAEIRRVLRPGGTLVVAVPSASAGSLGELGVARTMRPVHRGWRHHSALDQAGWLLAAADFSVLGDDRVSFALPIPDAAAVRALVARLPAARLWPADLPPDVRDDVSARLARRAGPDRVLPIPLRRLVARR